MTHLDELESQSIYLMREAFHGFEKPAMLWSMGKDSNVLLWLAKKAFCGHMPFPVVHVDTTYEFPEMIEFRAWAQKHYGFELIVWTNFEARGRGIGYETTDPVTVTHELKTVALQQVLSAYGYDALITGIRRDEDSKDQPPEFWNHFTTESGPGEHVRVQPLLDWTEIDIWRYLEREKVPLPGMYFSRNGQRYRSLGCMPISKPVKSDAKTIDDIIEELKVTRVSERSGRAQDHHERNAMQKLRAKGFM
jgi:sulfate adenylyltransferase subunit 2